MIAILQYGQFTSQVQIPGNEPRYTVHVIKPMEDISFVPLEDMDMSTVSKNILEFKLKDRLNKDIWLYEFVGEA
jgi:hypothetical protein